MTELNISKILVKHEKFKQGNLYPTLNKDSKIKCVMCGRFAVVVAPETDEPLCYLCGQKNEEARGKK